MKQINIFWDYYCDVVPMPYMEVKAAIERGDELIETYCTDFFCFDVLKKGYEVVVWKLDGSSVVLSKLLGSNPYIEKEIRYAHNARKMLVAGALEFIAYEGGVL